jgi:hypothetical protein
MNETAEILNTVEDINKHLLDTEGLRQMAEIVERINEREATSTIADSENDKS